MTLKPRWALPQDPNARRQLLLLAIALVFALLRFVGVPLAGQLQTAIEQHQLLAKNVNSARNLMDHRQRIEQDTQAAAAAQAQLARYAPSHPSTEAFKLATQKQIEAVVSATGLTLQNFDWLPEEQLGDLPLYRARAMLGLRGLASQVAEGQLRIVEALPGATLRSLLYSVSPDADDGVGRVFGQWNFDVWYQLTPPPAEPAGGPNAGDANSAPNSTPNTPAATGVPPP